MVVGSWCPPKASFSTLDKINKAEQQKVIDRYRNPEDNIKDFIKKYKNDLENIFENTFEFDNLEQQEKDIYINKVKESIKTEYFTGVKSILEKAKKIVKWQKEILGEIRG